MQAVDAWVLQVGFRKKSPSEAAVIQNQEYKVNWNDGGLPGAQVPNAPSSDGL